MDGGSVYTYDVSGNFEPAGRPRPTDMDGWLGGAHAVYLYQMGFVVLGAEASASWWDFTGSLLENPPPKGNDYHTSTEGQGLYSLSGRVGLAYNRWMLYGKGGYAWQDLDFKATFFNKDGPEGSNGSQVKISNTFAMSGLLYGGGVEVALTDRITFGVEYVRYDFNNSGVAVLPTTNSGITTEKLHAGYEIDTLTARLNFKF